MPKTVSSRIIGTDRAHSRGEDEPIVRMLKGPGARTMDAVLREQMSVALRAHRRQKRREDRARHPPVAYRYTRRQWRLVPNRTKRALLGVNAGHGKRLLTVLR